MKNKTLKLFKLFSLAVFIICFLNCEKEQLVGEQPVHDTLEFDKETFYKEWAAWEELGITDYSVKIKDKLPGTIPRFRKITVKDAVLAESESLDSDNSYMYDLLTISEMYVQIKMQFEYNRNVLGSINVIYNTVFHYPEIIDINFPPKEYSPNVFGSGVIYYLEFTPLTTETEE